jgi:hypothetical protein
VKKNSTILLTILSPLMLMSQISFSEPMIVMEAASYPDQTALADFDQDGDLDVLVCSSVERPALSWLENSNGDGLFNGVTTIADDYQVYTEIEVADLNSDGRMDVVAFCPTQGEILWFRNDGSNGQAWTTITIASPQTLYYCTFTLGDMDQDGDVDIIYFTDDIGGFRWIANDGTGQFGSHISFAAAESVGLGLITADMDGDGDLDVLYGDSNDGFIKWRENGDGQFSDTHLVTNLWYTDMNVADLNGDGVQDVLISAMHHTWWLAAQDSGTSYSSPMEIANWGGSSRSVDWDQDGDEDIVLMERWCTLFENLDGLGTFEAHCDTGDFWITEQNALSIGDINGDGRMDLLQSNKAVHSDFEITSTFNWYNNNGTWVPDMHTLDCRTQCLLTGDLNGDGIADLGMAGRDRIVWCSGLGEDAANIMHEIDVPLLPFFEQSAYIQIYKAMFADLDNDGDADLLYEYDSGLQTSPSWMLNEDGLGGFGAAGSLAGMFWAIQPADIDGDGDLDLLAAQSDSARIIWVENTGSPGLFTSIHPIFTIDQGGFENTVSPDVADMDGDGDQDVVALIPGENNNDLVWFENLDGGGEFSDQLDPNLIASDIRCNWSSLQLADVNLDGAVDAFVNELDGGEYRLVLYLNGYEGGTSIAEACYDYDLIDLDGDGDLDILMDKLPSTTHTPWLVWLENLDGLGSFAEAMVISYRVRMGSSYKHAAVADFDGDGILDIAGIYWQFGNPLHGSSLWLKGQNVTSTEREHSNFPLVASLAQNFPNPFNPTTTISYDLPEASKVTLTVYDLTGRTIRTLTDTHKPAGSFTDQWNGMNDLGNLVSTGVYFCRIQAGDYSKTIKMVYLK